jgi:hypothetical protein
MENTQWSPQGRDLQQLYDKWQREAAEMALAAQLAWVLVAVVGLVLAGSVLSGRWLFFGKSLAADHARMLAIAVIVAGVGVMLYSIFPLSYLLFRGEVQPGVVVGGVLIAAGIFAYKHVSKQHPQMQ